MPGPSIEHEQAVWRLRQQGATVGGFSRKWRELVFGDEPCGVVPDAWHWDAQTRTLTAFEVTKTHCVAGKISRYAELWWTADAYDFELKLFEVSAFGTGPGWQIELHGHAYAALQRAVAQAGTMDK